MLGIVWWRGGFAALPRRTALAAFAMGAVGYAAQSASYFAALDRIDASLLTLLLYIYPVLVMVGAVALKRESWSRRRLAALGLALAGSCWCWSAPPPAGSTGSASALGVTAALVYTAYILTGDRVLSGIAPLSLTALVCCGAATTYAVATVLRGGPTSLDAGPAAWAWLVTLALVSTVGAIIFFFAGLARVGPSVASILSILEPVVTVGLAAAGLLGVAVDGAAAGWGPRPRRRGGRPVARRSPSPRDSPRRPGEEREVGTSLHTTEIGR